MWQVECLSEDNPVMNSSLSEINKEMPIKTFYYHTS